MAQSAGPDLSVILLTPDSYATIRSTVLALAEQTVSEQLELVIVAPTSKDLDLPPSDVHALGTTTIVIDEATMESTGEARAAGIRAAHAPIVVLAEDHCFPQPQWAEALLDAHRGPWAAVGPELANANPTNPVAIADALTSSSDLTTLKPARSGIVQELPGRNSSYKRDILLAYGPELGRMLEMETVLHTDLQAHGHQLYLEARAKATHKNMVDLSKFLREQWFIGRVFANSRARRWPWVRRALYAACTPALPPLRLWRVRRALRRRGERLPPPNALALLGAALAMSALGELIGYVWGTGQAMRHLGRLEFRR